MVVVLILSVVAIALWGVKQYRDIENDFEAKLRAKGKNRPANKDTAKSKKKWEADGYLLFEDLESTPKKTRGKDGTKADKRSRQVVQPKNKAKR